MVKHIYILIALLIVTSCTMQQPHDVVKSDEYPEIYPDYIGVTIPIDIAPLNFNMENEKCERVVVTVRNSQQKELTINDTYAKFPLDKWRNFVGESVGDCISVQVTALMDGKWTDYKSFMIYVSTDSLSEYGLTYRRVLPTYDIYGIKMGIYERNLLTFDETPIIESSLINKQCVNCHVPNGSSAEDISMHIRGENGGTYIRHDGKEEMLDTKADSLLSACVYAYWHPSGKYIAYSLNTTRQSFHIGTTKRVEVYDQASDIIIYDVQKHEIVKQPSLMIDTIFETYPVFSSCGKYLYYCSALFPKDKKLESVRYDLCRVSFDIATGLVGNDIDTLVYVSGNGSSIAHPRPSYDGRYLMYAESDYGTFPIWHDEAELRLLDLQSGDIDSLRVVNSSMSDSYHTWAENSRWFVFTSRRDDGLHTRLYISHIDEEGNATKPFMLPQENPLEYYQSLFYSYNTPHFISSEVKSSPRRLYGLVKGERKKVRVR